MSATNRGANREPFDNYPTPKWCVHRLLEAVNLPGGLWLEPSAGEGKLIQAVNEVRSDVTWDAIDIRNENEPSLLQHANCYIGDFLQTEQTEGYSVLITNPPYSHALEFVKHGMGFADHVVMLLRLNFAAMGERAGKPEFLRAFPPDVYVLPNRPSFTFDNHTDATEYAWFVWSAESIERGWGRFQVLQSTDVSVRRPKN